MTERSEFAATFDMRQVNQALDETRAKSVAVVTANGQLADSMSMVEAAAKPAAAGFGALQLQAKEFRKQLAPQAAAISMITASLGENAGAAGKAVTAVGQLAAAYAAGGPLAVGLAGAAVAVNLLVQHWEHLIKVQQEALAKEFAATDEVSKIKNQLRADLQDLRLRTAEKDFTDAQKAYSSVQREIDAVYAKMVATLAKGKELSANEVEAARGLGVVIKELREKQRLAVGLAGQGKPTATAKSRGGGAKPGPVTYGEPGDIAAEFERQEEERQALVARAAAFAREARRSEIEDWIRGETEKREAAAETARLLKEQADEEARLAKERADTYTAIAGSMAAATGRLVAQGLAGQEDALEQFVAAASEAAGGFIMLEGGKVLAKGIAELIATGGTSPLGWAEVAGGGALVAAGAAIQSGGPAAVVALMGGGRGGGGGHAVTDRGAPTSRERSGGGGGGNITIVQQWGVAGPHAEDSARAVRRSLDLARRRRFAS